LIRLQNGLVPTQLKQSVIHSGSTTPQTVALDAVGIEQFLELSSTPASLADETLVDYLAARLRAAESVSEAPKPRPSWTSRPQNTRPQTTRISSDNEALVNDLLEVHRLSLAFPNHG